jgi:PAS domain S-box-containing protein
MKSAKLGEKKVLCMSQLKSISETVQRVAEAISAALGVETEIVDSDLIIIGGTGKYRDKIGKVEVEEYTQDADLIIIGGGGKYKDKIGSPEEDGYPDGDYLYRRVIRTGEAVVVKEQSFDADDGPVSPRDKNQEMAEICTPIWAGDSVIGVIALVAFTDEQEKHLLLKQDQMLLFLERMSELLGAKALEQEFYQELQLTKNEVMAILETAHEGMLAINEDGVITYSNSKAGSLLKAFGIELAGKPLSQFMPDSPALDVLKSGMGYTETEEIYHHRSKTLHFIVTTKPIQGYEKIAGAVISFRDISEARRLVYDLSGANLNFSFADIISQSNIMEHVKNQALRVALGYSTVLITGESGTGKELFARAIHFASDRQKGPFITVNCGAIPEALLESELFGYVGGAFTGALEKGKAGKFELADKGTIFLDEIGDMPLHLQVKLLHVLQKKNFERVGGNKAVHVDVRVIAATNRDLEKMIREKEFREDLYYRLNVIPIKIPPLRERREDIPLLVDHMLEKYSEIIQKEVLECSPEVIRVFKDYHWPGNVRELENAVEYAVTMCSGGLIEPDALPPRIKRFLYNKEGFTNHSNTLQEQVKEYEKGILKDLLSQYGDLQQDKLKIARDLGISRATLYRKLSEHHLS